MSPEAAQCDKNAAALTEISEPPKYLSYGLWCVLMQARIPVLDFFHCLSFRQNVMI